MHSKYRKDTLQMHAFAVYLFDDRSCKREQYDILYKLLFSRGFYFREFREPDPRENFPLQFMSIYSNDNIRKIAKLTTRELPQKSKKRENNCTRK